MRSRSRRYFSIEQQDSRLRNGLILHWQGVGAGGLTIPDWSGYGRHGVLTSSPGWDLGRNGAEPALNLSPTAYVLSTALPTTLLPVSFGAWIWRRGNLTYQVIFCHGASDSSGGWLLQINDSNALVFTLRQIADYTSSFTVPANQWTFVGFRTTGNNGTATIYMNRASQDISIGTPNTNQTWDRTTLGILENLSSTPFDGIIGAARLYNRCLSDAEMKLLADPALMPIVPARHRHARLAAAVEAAFIAKGLTKMQAVKRASIF